METTTKTRKQTTRQRKLECPTCGCIIRMSRKAMAEHGVPTCACGCQFVPEDVEDAALCGDDVLYSHPDAVAEMQRWERKARRESRRVGCAQLRCGGCGAFVQSAREACSCGFENDIHSKGRRNDGRWVEGASTCREARDEMPF